MRCVEEHKTYRKFYIDSKVINDIDARFMEKDNSRMLGSGDPLWFGIRKKRLFYCFQ